jgi:hypothetical protein
MLAIQAQYMCATSSWTGYLRQKGAGKHNGGRLSAAPVGTFNFSSVEPLCGRTAPADLGCGQPAHEGEETDGEERDPEAEARAAVAFGDHFTSGSQRGGLARSESAPDVTRGRLIGRGRRRLGRLAASCCSSLRGCGRKRSGRRGRSTGAHEYGGTARSDYNAAARTRTGVRGALGTGAAAVIPTASGG